MYYNQANWRNSLAIYCRKSGNDSFDKAREILRNHNYVIISDIPGIGKTTLDRMLFYDYLANGFEEFITLSGDIDTAAKLLKRDKKLLLSATPPKEESNFLNGRSWTHRCMV